MAFQKKKNVSGDTGIRRIISDVRPTAYGKLPNIPKTPVEKRAASSHAHRMSEMEKLTPRDVFSPVQAKPPVLRKNMFIVGVGVIFIAAFFGAIVWISTLTLAITRKTSSVNLGTGIAITIAGTEISAQVAERGEDLSRNEKSFSNKASGTILVYNNFSGAPQVLTERTRFRSPGGLLYRSKSRVVVPGKAIDKPGAVEVEVAADEAGEKYNAGLTDFTIPGFEGTPKFQKIYGRSKTEMKGGAEGTGKVVGREEADVLLKKLENDMRSRLTSDLEKKLTGDIISFPSKFDIAVLSRLTDPPVGSPATKFFGEVRGEAKTLVIARNDFANTLARVLFKENYKENIYLLSKNSAFSFKNIEMDYAAEKVTLTVEGKADFDWVIDIEKLKNEVRGAKSPSNLNDIYTTYPGIERVETTFQPWFFKYIPSNPKRIIIEVRE